MYPVTYKAETNVISMYVNSWAQERNYVQTALPLPSPNQKEYILVFTIYHSTIAALFGYFTDVIILVTPCTDIWGGVKIEAQASIRLGLQDYGSNEVIISDLF